MTSAVRPLAPAVTPTVPLDMDVQVYERAGSGLYAYLRLDFLPVAPVSLEVSKAGRTRLGRTRRVALPTTSVDRGWTRVELSLAELKARPGDRIEVRAVLADGTRSTADLVTLEAPTWRRPTPLPTRLSRRLGRRLSERLGALFGRRPMVPLGA